MMGYWNRPEETANAIVDGWMHTGDAGHMDEDGFVYIVPMIAGPEGGPSSDMQRYEG
jgi:long-chain acyl-CoA synthetase